MWHQSHTHREENGSSVSIIREREDFITHNLKWRDGMISCSDAEEEEEEHFDAAHVPAHYGEH